MVLYNCNKGVGGNKGTAGDSMTDTKALKELVNKKGIKYITLAAQLNLSYYGLKKKIDNKSYFNAKEIKEICDILNITSLKERDKIFFANNVAK